MPPLELEINPEHAIIRSLNALRQSDRLNGVTDAAAQQVCDFGADSSWPFGRSARCASKLEQGVWGAAQDSCSEEIIFNIIFIYYK